MSRLNKEVTKEELENSISLLDVIKAYVSLTQKGNDYIGLCPFHAEKNESFSYNSKKEVYKCFACNVGGNTIFSFVMSAERVTFKESLDILKKRHFASAIKRVNIPKKQSEVVIKFVDGPFTDRHLKYWEKLKMDAAFLESNNVFAVKEWAIGSKGFLKKVPATAEEITFAYYAKDIDKCKILRVGPEITFKDKWRNTVPNDYLWLLDTLPANCNKLFICKSFKDALVLQKMNRCSIAVQNESADTMLNFNVTRINSLCSDVIVLFGSDPQGVEQCKLITSSTGWNYFNIEKQLYTEFGVEDPADYLNEGFSYKMLDKKLKQKKL